ncbi:MAG TPA: thioredoxin domain-containing protein, partial [Saprospiraceae bacterium]|nr:thioredoxin domain-containing protein [Saprospiraceae bacterium]
MNKLQSETSPYLLQHAHNPVDWYAWRPEAFERARAEQKPILVSIGYSTCHWCHVMERESFENEDIAAFMNERFINIKVDREERPDVDAIYMDACQILTGGGGWPLNCFLTPEGKPFYAGTYFPPRPAHNRPSWLQLLQHLANIWETQRDVALDQAEKLTAHIARSDDIFIQKPSNPNPETLKPSNPETLQPSNPPTLKPSNLESIYYQMRERFDRVEGGFGGAPKFPSTMAIQYLLNYHWFTGNPEALEQAVLSLDKMIHGGIYDQLGGGFARYATDREWLVPHFEKMIYDNALLVSVLSEAYKLTGKALYKETIEETLHYVRREMTGADGGFYSAQDADSEGVEGKFYVWDKGEIGEILGGEAQLFCAFYGVTEHGNWEEKNILWRPVSYEAFAAANDTEVGRLKSRLQSGREKLFAVRSKRIWPGLDNKVLLSWNALMTSAYCAAFTALGNEEYRTTAVRNIEFL